MENDVIRREPSMEKKKSNKKKGMSHLVIYIILLIVFVVCLFLASGMLAYKYGTDNAYLKMVTKLVPYPAATVNGDVITLSQYNEEVDLIKNLVLIQQGQISEDVDKQINSDVMDKLIHDRIIRQLAKKFKIKLTDEDIENEKNKIVEESGISREELEQKIQELYNWDFDTFFYKIVITSVYQEKVREAYTNSEDVQKETEKTARDILKLIQKGEQSFQDIAKEHSQDTQIAELGGDLGWMSRDDMPEEIAEVAFNLEKGDVSDLIKTEFGYHIIKIEDTRDGENQEVWLFNIYIPFASFEEFLQQTIAESNVRRYIEY